MPITYDQLRSTVASGGTSPTEYALTLSALQSAAVDGLAQTYLQDGQLALLDYHVVESAPDQTVTLTGTGTKLPFTGTHVEAVFSLVGGEAALAVTATGTSTWGFDSAFPILAGSTVASVRFSSPTLLLASNPSDPGEAGVLRFSGTVDLGTYLDQLAALFGSAPPVLSGSIGVHDGVPVMALTTRAASVELGLASDPVLTFSLVSTPVADDQGQLTDAEVYLQFRAVLTLAVDGEQYPVSLAASVYDPKASVILSVETDGLTDLLKTGLDALAHAVAGTTVSDALPKVDGLSVEDLVTLRDVVLVIDPSGPNRLTSATLEVASSGRWTIVPSHAQGDELAIEGLQLSVTIPMDTKRPQFDLSGTVDLGDGAGLYVSAFAPDLSVMGSLVPGSVVSLGDMVQRFARADTSSFPDVEVAGFAFSAEPGRSYSVDLDVRGTWPVPLGFVDLTIDEVSLSASYATGSRITGSITGVLTVDDVDVTVSAAHPGTGQWAFTGTAATDRSIELVQLLDALLPEKAQVPQDMVALDVRNLKASWDTGSKRFTFDGETDLALTLGPRQLRATVTASIDSVLDATTSQRQTGGTLHGLLGLGGSSFELLYAFSPTTQVLSGTWTAQGALSYRSLASAVDIGVPGFDDILPDLGLRSASFEIDYAVAAGDRFVVNATTDHGSAFFALQRPRPTDPWGFVFGAAVTNGTKLSDLFGLIGHDVEVFDYLRLESAFFLVASAQFPAFSVPAFPGLETHPIPVPPGASAGVVLDLAQSQARPETTALTSLLGERPPRLVAEVTVARRLSDVAVTVDLGGDLRIKGTGRDSLTLSDTALVIRLSPPALTIRGALAVTLDDVALDAVGMLTISDAEIEAAFDIQGQNGQVLPIPMGFKGVHLTDLGVVVGVVIEPPQVEMGLLGRFVVGEPTAHPRGPVPRRALDTMPPADEFVLIVGLEGEVPNPILLSLFLQELSVAKAVEAFTDQVPTDLPEVLTDIKATDLMIYWCDVPTIQQPDGTWASAGFGFNANLDILGFTAHAALKIDAGKGITGDASLSPIHIRDVVDVTGDGPGTPSTYKGQVTVAPGGARIHVSTASQPYLDVDLTATLFKTVTETLKARVDSSGILFEVDYKVGDVFTSALRCSVSKWTHFEVSFSIELDLRVDMPEILGVDLGDLDLSGTGFDGKLVVDVAGGFSLTIDGGFEFQGTPYRMPTVRLSESLASLEEIPKAVARQIQREAETIFKDLIAGAQTIVQRGLDEAGAIGRDAETTVDAIADQAERDYQAVVAAGEREAEEIRRQIEAEVDQALREADRLLQDAARRLKEVEAQLAEAARQVEHMATEAEHEAARVATSVTQAAATETRSAANTVKDVAQRAENAVANAAKDTWHAITSIF